MFRHEDGNMFCNLRKFEELLDVRTDSFLSDLIQLTIPEICDFILQNDIEPKLIFTTMQKKITNYYHLIFYVLLILHELDDRAQNCGTLTHDKMTIKQYMRQLEELIKMEYYVRIPTSKNVNPSNQGGVVSSRCISSQSSFVIEASTSFNNDGLKDTAITQALIYMICKDNMHTKTVENEGLIHLIETLCPMYKMPSGSTLTNLIEERCDAYFKRLYDQVNCMSLTATISVIYTNGYSISLVIICGHFVNVETSMLESYCMKALYMKEITEENIVKALNRISEKCISPSQFVCMTVGAHCIPQKAERLFTPYPKLVWCFGDMTNEVVQNSLEKISEIIEIISEIRHIVTFFIMDYNTDAFDALTAEQLKNGTSEGDTLYPIQDMPGQWNSTFKMMENFAKLAPTLKVVLANECNKDGPQMMDQSKIEVVYDVINLLAPFKEATAEISVDKYTTASTVLPLYYNVRETLNALHPTTCFAKKLKKNLLKEIEIKYAPFEENTLFVIATLLDPRFKKIYSFPPISEANAISQVCREVSDIANHQKSSLFSKQKSSNTSQKDSNSIWTRHTERVEIYDKYISEQMPHELKSYFNAEVLPLPEDPVSYWLNCKTLYPALAQVALKYCTIMGSSITPTRVGSMFKSLGTVQPDEKNIKNYINKAFFLAHFTKNMFPQ